MTDDVLQAAHRERYGWIEAVLADAKLTPGAKNVAVRLALHKNVKSGRCNPGIETLSHGTGMTRRGVQKALDAIEKLGWIKRTVGGHGRTDTNSYELLWANGRSPCSTENSGTDALRANHGSVKSERKGEQIDAQERTPVRSNIENTPNLVKNISAEPDRDGDARASNTDLDLQMKAKSLAIRLATIAGIRSNQTWPLHWQQATKVILRWWVKGFTDDQIVTGAQLTMQHKKIPGPPLSIEYFSDEIGKVAKLQSRSMPPAEHGRCLREIVAKLGLAGWEIMIALSEGEVNDLVLRWSKGEVTDGDLHRIMAEIEARGTAGSATHRPAVRI